MTAVHRQNELGKQSIASRVGIVNSNATGHFPNFPYALDVKRIRYSPEIDHVRLACCEASPQFFLKKHPMFI